MNKPPANRSYKILVIDDDHYLVELLKSNFEGLGFAVLSGYDGQMAIYLAKTEKPHLIVMDVNMPMTSGLKALEFLRKVPETAKIPVIFLTGANSNTVYPAIEASSPGSPMYIKKPLDLEHLNSMVTQFLQQYQSPS